MAAFTTWRAFYQQLLNDAVNGNWRIASYDIGGVTGVRYKTWEDLQNAIQFAKHMADNEDALVSPRTHAKPSGGRW